MFAAARIKIRKVTPGQVPGEHVAAIVAAALSIVRKQASFDARFVELQPDRTEQGGDWVALGRATVHPAGARRSPSKRAPAPIVPPARVYGGASEAAD